MRHAPAKVAVAMSGGVDSSVAAMLLLEMGCEVVGMTMRLFDQEGERPEVSAADEAARVAAMLGIPHQVVDLRGEFARQVISYFRSEYELGRTPNPCIRCNRTIKFGALWEKASETGAEHLATGHYARLGNDPGTSRHLLKRGLDAAKDQSYFLYGLTQEQIARTLMPLGELTKKRVREMAAERGLPSAARQESQEICFIPGDDYAAFLAAGGSGAVRPGDIVDLSGRVLGRHRGIIHHTVGQRKGLGIAWSEPLYVVAIDPDLNRVVVGTEKELLRGGLIATEVNWIALSGLQEPLTVEAVFRYRMRPVSAELRPLPEGRVEVTFQRPQRAVAPGQSVVFYEGGTVLGGGIIEAST